MDRGVIHSIVSGAFCGAYLLTSIPIIAPVMTAGRFGPIDPFHSSNSYLEELTQTRHASERILQIVSTLPSSKTIAIALPGNDEQGAFVEEIVAYLCWPRELRWVPVANENVEDELRAIDPETLSAVIFWKVKPPSWMPPGVTWGEGITIVPLVALDAGVKQ